ncbi:hypothetical protein TKK_0011702 [Trichogramma kaykai]
MALYGAGAWGEALRRKEMRDELIRCQRMVLSACMRVCHTVPTVAMQVLAGSPPWDLRCLMRRTKYRIRRGLALDDLDLVADDGSGMRNLLLKCDEEVMNKWQSDWDSSDKGRVTYEFAPDVRSSMNWCKWMNVGWLVGYILTGKGGLNFYQHKIDRAPSPLCECGAVEDWLHLLVYCPRYEAFRNLDELGVRPRPDNTFDLSGVLSSKENFQRLTDFISRAFSERSSILA